MPGAPADRLVSVAVMRTTPFCRNEIVEPTTVSFSWVPAAAWETIASPPSLVSVQFAPRLPSDRLKSSEPPVAELFVHETATLVTLAEPMVPEPLETEQDWPVGLVFTVTL